MVSAVSDHLPAIQSLCRKHGVRELVLFGSASREDDFNDSTSDIDLIVDFLDYHSPHLADQYLGLMDDLQKMLNKPVQLASKRTILPRMSTFLDPRPVTLFAA